MSQFRPDDLSVPDSDFREQARGDLGPLGGRGLGPQIAKVREKSGGADQNSLGVRRLRQAPVEGRHEGSLAADVLRAGDVSLREQVAEVRQLALDPGGVDHRALDLCFAPLESLDVCPPVSRDHERREPLADLIFEVRRATAHANRYPLAATEGDRVTFDAQAARILTRKMDISANEAADPRLWAFLACVVVPDIVRWRFPGGASGTSEERFVGKSRGLRNTLGRLWWRSHLLRTPDGAEDPLGRLGEDELVQITERTSIAGSPRLATQLADSFLEAVDRYPRVSRSILMRDAMKRIRRLAAFVEFDVLEDDGLFDLVDGVFEASAAERPQ